MKQILRRLVTEDSGQDLIEYAMVTAIVALGLVTIIRGLQVDIGKVFGGVGTVLTNAV